MNDMLVSGIQQSDSVIHILYLILYSLSLSPWRLLQNIEQRFLIYLLTFFLPLGWRDLAGCGFKAWAAWPTLLSPIWPEPALTLRLCVPSPCPLPLPPPPALPPLLLSLSSAFLPLCQHHLPLSWPPVRHLQGLEPRGG